MDEVTLLSSNKYNKVRVSSIQTKEALFRRGLGDLEI